MRDKGILFHNVMELEEGSMPNGVSLHRFPRQVRHSLGERGKFISRESSGCELRFVTTASQVWVTLSALENDGDLVVYKGGYFHSRIRLQAGAIHTLRLEEPARWGNVSRGGAHSSGFAPEVWRMMAGRFNLVLFGIDTFGHPIRPPHPDEMPKFKWLAYGSSITHGLANQQMSYVHQTARRLGIDVYNLGMSGSCACEKEMADAIAARQDWDLATFELGVNMRDHFTPDEFRERSAYLLHAVLKHHPDKPVALITIFPNYATRPLEATKASDNEKRFNEILREHVREINHPHLHLLEGDAILRDFSTLSCDLIHPGEMGHTLMAQNLSDRLKIILDESRQER